VSQLVTLFGSVKYMNIQGVVSVGLRQIGSRYPKSVVPGVNRGNGHHARACGHQQATQACWKDRIMFLTASMEDLVLQKGVSPPDTNQ